MPRQAGIDTPQQTHLAMLAYDHCGPTGPEGAAALRDMLVGWTRAVTGQPLTANLGIGPALPARLPLAVPAGFRELPPLPGDRLESRRSGADLLVQLSGDEPEAIAAVADALDRQCRGLVAPRWRQWGHLLPSPAGQTPRNLFAFKDGTANPGPADDRWIWLADAPYAGATFLVYRRIAMAVDTFEAQPIEQQEAVIGRHRDDGRPLGGAKEHDEPDFYAKTPDGRYVIPATAHIRLANPRLDGGARMLRRGYTYADGPDEKGLLFCAYMKDPALFVRIQQRMAEHDALTRFTEHRASAVLYLPPGAPKGAPLGDGLFGRPATGDRPQGT
ncbi:Putative Tat-translocated enzyme [Kitasatospora sp. MMS16-BH015]|nr:Putative Tat-translocated enzyme [Kitasatospora sp. MMS16-BH015]